MGDCRHMPAHDSPRRTVLAGPHPCIPKAPLHLGPADFHHQRRAEGRDRDIAPDTSNAELLDGVLTKSHLPGRMRRQVLRLRTQLTIRASEEQVVGEQSIERADIGVELGTTQCCFQGDDLGVGVAEQDVG